MSVDRNSQDNARTRRALQRLLAAGVLHEHVTREEPAGLSNGVNLVFTLAHVPLEGSEEVYLNGVLQDNFDYTLVGQTLTLGGLTVLLAPIALDEIRVSYLKQPS